MLQGKVGQKKKAGRGRRKKGSTIIKKKGEAAAQAKCNTGRKRKADETEGDAPEMSNTGKKRKVRNDEPIDDVETIDDITLMQFFHDGAKKIKGAKSFAELEDVVKDICPFATELGPPVRNIIDMEEAYLVEDGQSSLLLPTGFQDKVRL